MDKEKIISFLTSGVLSSQTDAKVPLKDIVHTFPYFQLAQVLYAKQLYDDNDTEVAARVKLASAYAPNRKAMYLLFRKQNPKAVEQEVKPVEAKPIVKEEQKYNYVYQVPETYVPKETPKAETIVVALPKAEPELPIKAEAKIEIKSEPITPVFNEIKVENKAKTEIKSENQIAEEPKEEVKPSSVSETFFEKEIFSNIAASYTENTLTDLPVIEPKKDVKEHIEEPKKPEIDLSGKHSFEYWLKALPETGNSKKTETSKPRSNSDIIERFLTNEPRISVSQKPSFSPLQKRLSLA